MEPITYSSDNLGYRFMENMRHQLSQKLDVTIIIDGQMLYGNKMLLSGFSKVFKELISESEEENVTIPIKGYNFEDIKSLVDYLMTGHVEIEPSRIASFQDCAEKLKVLGFTPESSNEKPIDDAQKKPKIKVGLLPLGNGKVLCVPCQKEFSRMDHAKTHEKVKHPSDPNANFPCIVCGKNFPNEVYFFNHMRRDHKITKKMYENMQQY